MKLFDALGQGWADVNGVRRYVAFAYGLNVALSLPLAAAVAMDLHASLEGTVAAENMRRGWDDLWHRNFSAEASGLASTFDPSVTGIGAVFNALEALLGGGLLALPAAIAWMGILYTVAWVFLSGGFLARFCGQPGRSFFGDAAVLFPRMLGLAAAGWAAAFAALYLMLPVLAKVVAEVNYDTIDERIHFGWTLAKYAIVWGVLWTVGLVVDYAKIAVVTGKAESLQAALRIGASLVRSNARAIYGLSALVLGLGAAVVAAYWVFAPGANQHNGLLVAIAFAISQTYVIAKVVLRCLGLAAHARLGGALLGVTPRSHRSA